MKSSTFPSLRVTPELREAAENVLEEGETLSGFVESSVRAQIEKRRAQRDFLARGLASRDAAMASGEYFSAEDVLNGLDELLTGAKARAST